MMNVAIIGTKGYPYVYGGYETFAKHLAERLVKRNIRVTIYCHRGLFPSRPKEVNGIRLVYMPGFETKVLSQPTHSFLSMIHAACSKADVLLVVNAANGIWGFIPRLLGKPAVINVDGMEWERPKWKGLGAKFFYFSAKMATRLYDIIITDAEAMRERYKRIFGVDSRMIAYGTAPHYVADPSLLDKWGLQPYDYYLVIGRLIPDNNADVIIEGYMRSGSRKKLVILGDVSYKDAYADRVKAMANENLLFTGYVTDNKVISELYHNCFAYLHGHEFGGTNPTMVEALGHGTAILALDTDFSREMLSGGRFGKFFTKDPETLAALIRELEADPQEAARMRQTSTQAITQAGTYDWEAITSQYIEVLQDAIALKRKAHVEVV